MRLPASSVWVLASVVSLAACGANGGDELVEDLDATPRRDAGSAPADASLPSLDAGATTDASVRQDATAPTVDSSAPVVDSSVPPAETGAPVVDAGTPVVDAGSPAVDAGRADAGSPVVDSGSPVADAGGPTVAVGAACTGAANDCRMATPLSGFCSAASPTVACMATGCTITSPTAVDYCDSNRGVCLAAGTTNYCVQKCSFGNSTAAPTGCAGTNTCNAYSFSRDAGGTVSGVGYCLGTCTSNAECPTGFVCQIETGTCTAPANLKTYTLTVGSACTAGTTTTCNCVGRTGQPGICTKSCIVGRAGTCATGFSCSADIPKTFSDASTAFTATPTGLAGSCWKNCTVNADCPTGTVCDINDTVGKVCKPVF
jgi:Cys-rich repeat protein